MTDAQTPPPFDPTPTYSRAHLESILGEPDTVQNFRSGEINLGRPMAGGSPREEPIRGKLHVLGWACQTAEFACMAIAVNSCHSSFRMSRWCAQHDVFDPYRSRVVTDDDRRRRATWINALWQELSILDGIVHDGCSAHCGELWIVLDECDPADPRKIDVADLRFGTSRPSGHQGVCLSIINCSPRRAAFLIIGLLLSGSQVEVHVSGAPEPVRMILEGEFGDPKSTGLNGTAPNGDEFSIEYDTIKRITLA